MFLTQLFPADKFMSTLVESATAEIYHYCSINNAVQILRDGCFKLSTSVGNGVEAKYTLPGYPYFLSTTRSKVGDYHRYAGSSACMFVLDGNWFNNHYKSKPVDYWDRMWANPESGRTSESEDRVYSKTPTIPLGGVKAAHILLTEQNDVRSAQVRGILIQAKKMGIPTYFYTDEKPWRLQDTRRAIPITKNVSVLRGHKKDNYSRYGKPYESLSPWYELMVKDNKAALSDRAEKLRYNLVYYGTRYPSDDSGLGTDFANSRKPESGGYDIAVKIIDYMRKNKIQSILDLKNMIAQKWYDMANPAKTKEQ